MYIETSLPLINMLCLDVPFPFHQPYRLYYFCSLGDLGPRNHLPVLALDVIIYFLHAGFDELLAVRSTHHLIKVHHAPLDWDMKAIG